MRAQCIYTICIHTFLMPFYHEKLLDGVDCQIAPSKSSIIKWKLQSVRVRLNFAKLWNLGQNAHVHAECMRYACGRKLNVRMWVRATWKSVATHSLTHRYNVAFLIHHLISGSIPNFSENSPSDGRKVVILLHNST